MSEAATPVRSDAAVGTFPYGVATIGPGAAPAAERPCRPDRKVPQGKMSLLPNVVYRTLVRSRLG